jgi:ubiquinone/menaquinone biosynthesis C-methylase UbiE
MREKTAAIEESTLLEGVPKPVRALWERFYEVPLPPRFAEMLARNISPVSNVLEIGAGSGRNQQHHFELRGKVARYAGVDSDSSVLTNPHLDEGYNAKAETLPVPDASFDLVFHYYVAEHFEKPMVCNREIARVLKPGGVLMFQTPSRFYYVSLIAQVTPQWFHEFYVGRFASGRTSNEVFPTYYRLNDDRTISRQMRECGFTSEIEHRILPPGYLRFSRLSFLAGVLYERTMEKLFPSLRATIIVTARKTLSAQANG